MIGTVQNKNDKQKNMTKEKFLAYLAVRDSGATNMFDTTAVIRYAEEIAGVELTREDCLEIMRDFLKLKYEYLLKNEDGEK